MNMQEARTARCRGFCFSSLALPPCPDTYEHSWHIAGSPLEPPLPFVVHSNNGPPSPQPLSNSTLSQTPTRIKRMICPHQCMGSYSGASFLFSSDRPIKQINKDCITCKDDEAYAKQLLYASIKNLDVDFGMYATHM